VPTDIDPGRKKYQFDSIHLSFWMGNPRICQRADGLKRVLIQGTNTPSPIVFLQGKVGISWDDLMRHDSFFPDTPVSTQEGIFALAHLLVVPTARLYDYYFKGSSFGPFWDPTWG